MLVLMLFLIGLGVLLGALSNRQRARPTMDLPPDEPAPDLRIPDSTPLIRPGREPHRDQ